MALREVPARTAGHPPHVPLNFVAVGRCRVPTDLAAELGPVLPWDPAAPGWPALDVVAQCPFCRAQQTPDADAPLPALLLAPVVRFNDGDQPADGTRKAG